MRKEGIVPKHNSKIFSYPERVYLFTDKNDSQELKLSGFLFAKLNKQESIKEEIEYSLLFIDVDKLPKDMHFSMIQIWKRPSIRNRSYHLKQ